VRALLQRVSRAEVVVCGETIGAIGHGVLVFLGIGQGDDIATGEKLADRILNYRIFADRDGRMNLNVRDVGGGVLMISQFTLVADTSRGLRPSFTPAAVPAAAEPLCEAVVARLRRGGVKVASGLFGADMQVSLCNDGPVTFLLEMLPR